MIDYQTKKSREIMSNAQYKQIIFIIRDYRRMQEEAAAIIVESVKSDGQPQGNSKGSTVEAKAMKRERNLTHIKAIDDALLEIPQEYRKGVWENIVLNKKYPDDASIRTYKEYKSRLIYSVGKKLYIC